MITTRARPLFTGRTTPRARPSRQTCFFPLRHAGGWGEEGRLLHSGRGGRRRPSPQRAVCPFPTRRPARGADAPRGGAPSRLFCFCATLPFLPPLSSPACLLLSSRRFLQRGRGRVSGAAMVRPPLWGDPARGRGGVLAGCGRSTHRPPSPPVLARHSRRRTRSGYSGEVLHRRRFGSRLVNCDDPDSLRG
ncbi:hypothetical protein I4F81_010469 [Pyropia yezoensis]|uniref:Uncharacterized protein n=1 Tax=Pyropia yezoensis TaxID=2788 RepID=A0ACC3CDW4_PYRYE|nr:hypothetical protein I4F81_010469 [Neopyropia yezoensis]